MVEMRLLNAFIPRSTVRLLLEALKGLLERVRSALPRWRVLGVSDGFQALTWDVGYANLVAGAEATETLLRGFTTVRDVGGPVFGLKRAIDEGVVAGPRILPRRWRSPALPREARGNRTRSRKSPRDRP